jgi:hypothetical protein
MEPRSSSAHDLAEFLAVEVAVDRGGAKCAAVVVIPIRRVGAHDAGRKPFKGGVEDAVPDADAGGAGWTEDLLERTIPEGRRIMMTTTSIILPFCTFPSVRPYR